MVEWFLRMWSSVLLVLEPLVIWCCGIWDLVFLVFDSFLDDTLALAKPMGIAMNSSLFLEPYH
jgi:hypothetical protein